VREDAAASKLKSSPKRFLLQQQAIIVGFGNNLARGGLAVDVLVDRFFKAGHRPLMPLAMTLRLTSGDVELH